jgi:hypothetical protein
MRAAGPGRRDFDLSRPLTAKEVREGRLRNYEITIRQTGSEEAITRSIAAISPARALRVWALRLANPDHKGPAWAKEPDFGREDRG